MKHFLLALLTIFALGFAPAYATLPLTGAGPGAPGVAGCNTAKIFLTTGTTWNIAASTASACSVFNVETIAGGAGARVGVGKGGGGGGAYSEITGQSLSGTVG